MGWGRCTLYFAGADFEPDAFLAGTPLTPSDLYRRGEPRYRPDNEKLWEQSGIGFDISEATTVDEQAADAIQFLRVHSESFGRLAALESVEERWLTIAYECRLNHATVAVQKDYVPFELCRLTGEFAINIQLMLYPSGFWD